MTNKVSVDTSRPGITFTALLDELLVYRAALEQSERLNTPASDLTATEVSNSDKTEHIDISVELPQAQVIHHQAIELVSNSLKEITIGHPIDIDLFYNLTNGMVDSVLRNHNALACIGRIRDKDNYLLQHSVNAAILMGIFAHSLKMDRERIKQIIIGAMLHDIGKLLTPHHILHKPGRLTEDEFEVMKLHVSDSRDLLKQIPGLSELSIKVAAQHHERVDGSGYPDGLKADEICREGKMCAIVDVYDAITADRDYHKGMPPALALQRLLDWSGTHLDAELVNCFISAMGIYPVSSLVLLNNDKLAVVLAVCEKNPNQPTIKVIYDSISKQPLKPEILDLSKMNGELEIKKAVNPALYNIRVADFLN